MYAGSGGGLEQAAGGAAEWWQAEPAGLAVGWMQGVRRGRALAPTSGYMTTPFSKQRTLKRTEFVGEEGEVSVNMLSLGWLRE